uniref:Dna-directed rna polymerase iii subunit rpc4 n=1 Tax=Triatoma infestans TaxID=30076 RepID=A0A161M412_TRIIF
MGNVNGLEEDVSKPLSLTSMKPFTIAQLLDKIIREESFYSFRFRVVYQT